MLLDAKHKPWIVAVAVLTAGSAAAYVPYHLSTPNGPSGGSWVGIAFGLAAFLLMAFVGLLGARRKFPTLRIGRPETWMRAHLWLGFLIVPLAFFHGGFRFGGTLTTVLMILLILVTLSGFFGLALQQILPRVLTARAPMETIYEELERVLQQLLAEADALVPDPDPKAPPAEDAVRLREFYQGQVRPFLDAAGGRGKFASAPAAAAAFTAIRTLLPPARHEVLKDLEIMCEERRQLAAQKRLHGWLHGWILVHVPLSYALLLLSGVHAIGSVRY